MMAAVFFMQPIGQLVAQLVGLWVLYGLDNHLQLRQKCVTGTNDECIKIVDKIWRIVSGVGAVPALLAIVFRFMIWDSGLYDIEVKRQTPRAFRNTKRVYRSVALDNDPLALQHLSNTTTGFSNSEAEIPLQFSRKDLHCYLIKQGNWRYLAGTSTCWFLLDFAFFGLGMGNPRTLAKIWSVWDHSSDIPTPPSWNTNPTFGLLDPPTLKWNVTIYDVLESNATQSIETVSIASILGGLLFIVAVNYIPHRRWLVWSFVSLAIMLILTGGTFEAVFHTRFHIVTVVLVAVCHFLFNFGKHSTCGTYIRLY
jgi:PHS family inorganic phosphate transporter-like MFS transporter